MAGGVIIMNFRGYKGNNDFSEASPDIIFYKNDFPPAKVGGKQVGMPGIGWHMH